MTMFKLSALCSALISTGIYAVEKPIQKDEQSIETLAVSYTHLTLPTIYSV